MVSPSNYPTERDRESSAADSNTVPAVSVPGRESVLDNRRRFLTRTAAASAALAASAWIPGPVTRGALAAEMARSAAVRSGKARHLTVLHTTDIHAQLEPHDELFYEDGRAVFKRRGGFATLRTMVEALRRQNPGNTLLVDGGDCFQGSAVASLSKGMAIVPLVNRIGYDLMLPGNWEVVYGKQILLRDFGLYSAAKVCANMFHAEDGGTRLMFPAYHVFRLGGLKAGFIGYNDPFTPTRQPPAFSEGIRFTLPEEDLARHVVTLREREGCDLVFVLAHLGLAQQLRLANDGCAKGVDYILGGDTHERIREPLQGAYAKVTEPGAFASFIGKLDVVVEDRKIREEAYELLEVDPERYPGDEGTRALVVAAQAPYRKEIDRVLGRTRTPLLRYYVIETPIDNLITDAMMWKFGTDLVVSNGFRFCPPLVPPPGGEADITNGYLWSMLPVDFGIRSGVVTGQQILDWLEQELEKTFSKDFARRAGGWLVRFKGLHVKFTVAKEPGQRVQEVIIRGEPLAADRQYTVLGCEREGDPPDMICRLGRVAQARTHDITIHQVMIAYLASNSPVAPVLEGRAVATDAPADLLSQMDGTTYRFR